MSRLIETIRISNGKVNNIKYHNSRCNHSRQVIFNSTDKINLRKFITIPLAMRKGIVKCRITYDDQIRKIEFEKYKIKDINTVKCVHTNRLYYDHKYANRTLLKECYDQRGKHDDIVIINNQNISDGYYTNLAFYDGSQWITPKHCLLAGTQRQQLIDKGIMKVKSLKEKDLDNFEKMSMFNALIPFKTISVKRANIFK